jgi:hypothetical protein
MSSKKSLVPSLLFLSVLAACSPAVVPAAPVEIQATSTEGPANPTTAPIVEATSPPTSTTTPEEEQVFPYFLPLATKPDIPPQTIDGVTAQIDWVYVDESRVTLHYTISGLDWPDGTTSDAMSVRITSSGITDTAYSGGGSWGNTPVEGGVMTGTIDQSLKDGAFDASKYPNVHLRVDIPVEGPTSVGTFRFELDVPVLDGIRMENLDHTVITNDVSMILKSLTLNPSHAEALICFEMPSAVDWGLTASTITVGGKEYSFSGAELVHTPDGKYIEVTDPERCNRIGFDIPYDESASSITLTVPNLLASVPEVVTPDRVQMANARLADKGIQFDYENIDHGGNIVIQKRPDGMEDVEIYPLIRDALAEQYEGPWVFTVQIPR